MKKMGLEGMGPKIAMPGVAFLILAAYLDDRYNFRYVEGSVGLLEMIGIILVVLGFLFLCWSAANLIIAYKKNVLAKTGPYKMMLNPLYMAWVIFIIPGLSFYFNSWILLILSLVIYCSVKIFVSKEYKYLKEKFGSEYDEYEKQVILKFL